MARHRKAQMKKSTEAIAVASHPKQEIKEETENKGLGRFWIFLLGIQMFSLLFSLVLAWTIDYLKKQEAATIDGCPNS
jgi:hypothetical protein